MTAFKALKPKEREAVWQKLVTDPKLGDDRGEAIPAPLSVDVSYSG